MRTSENIDQLATALASAQSEMKNAKLNKVNPHFKSKYADLAEIRDTVTPALSKHGIAVVNGTDATEGGLHVVTRLIHKSGQWIESRFPIAYDKPQTMGSAITYGKRYNLAAVANIAADEDDDANAASKKFVKPEPKPEPKVEPKVETKIPAHIEGFDTGWQIKVTVTPEANLEDWSEKITQAAKTGLTFCANKTDVTDLFKVNRNIFDKLKQLDPGTYKLLMEDFSSTKAKFEKGDEA